ncbi:CDP-glycerol glycerophosphotransferase family protein [Streptomyces sp. NPDC048483]|uniref:bifunctional glycosyltransferase/CDP-glycerol:glycerophosphate glycerophosphotransferase n=1 Tax=Streptomyces sp. NPDC048483 TaxID=3154927 RepID=UPI0034150FAC
MKPRLTVVVPVPRPEGPVRNVEECLESVAAQTLTELDVVLVEGGCAVEGPAEGAALVRAFADRDPRFRVVRHRGGRPGGVLTLGAARNAGARHASPHSDYLAFLDADDVLLPRAYEDLTGLLDRSGADFATGNVYRLGAAGRSQSRQHPAVRDTVLRTHVTEDRTLLSDHFARNKVFRRAFWDLQEFAFPEGELCDDAAVTVPAHFLARAVAVRHDHVVHWRLPEGAARHRRPDVPGVRERFAAVGAIRRFLADPAHPARHAFRRDYDRWVLTDGLLDLVAALPAAAPECRAAFLEGARDVLAGVDPRLFPTLPVELRMRWYLIRAGRLADLVALLAYEARNPAGFDVVGPPLRKRAVLPFAPLLELPPGVTRLDRTDLPVRARVLEAVWRWGSARSGRAESGGGSLVLRGYAYIRNLDVPARHGSLRTVVLAQGRRRILLPLRPVAMPRATAESGQERHCYDGAGFEVTLDPARLRRGGRWEEGDWTVGVIVASAGVVRAAALRVADTGSGASPLAYEVGEGGVRIVPRCADGRLRLSVERPVHRLTGHHAVSAEVLELTVTAPGPLPVALRLTHQGAGTVVTFPVEPDRAAGTAPPGGAAGRGEAARPGDLLTLRLRPGALAAARPAREGVPRAVPPVHSETWMPELVLPGGGTAPIACPPGLSPAGHPLPHGRELVVAATATGCLVLHDRTPQPYVDRVVWRADGTLLVAGWLPDSAPPAVEIVLRHGAHAVEAGFPATRDGGRFHCALPLGALPSLAGELPLREGRWTLHLREPGVGGASWPGGAEGSGAGSFLDAPVRFAPAVFDGLPVSRTVRGKPLTLDRYRHDEAFVAAGPALPATDRGPYRRRVLRELHYPLHRGRPLREAVLYSSFGGRSYGDSPRAVHEELVRRGADVTHLWAVRDAQAAMPDTARAVVVGSAEWHGALAHSRWVVTNTHLPSWFLRRDGQTVVQTWHGTPLKQIGAHLAGTFCAGLAHLAPRPHLGRQWSVLLSPNAHSTPVLRSALGYRGGLVESGLPRTDALVAADRDRAGAAVRARLGIEPGRTVVLYAPTLRDDLAYDAAHHRLHLPLDLGLARSALSDGHVLLVRSHPLVADRLPALPRALGSSPTSRGTPVAPVAPFALDVSDHPDATELLLAADVLVTDYSSLAADFANTGRPMLFLTPDLPHYRDTLRGFTLDFEARVPGPLLASTGELIDALGDLAGIARAGAEAYADFREAFCHLDDGGAAARVADLLTG